MSIINKMLQDLDRRHGMSDTNVTPALSQVRTVTPARKDREWFWRIIALLMIIAVGWVGWIAWQLQPRESIATEQAFKVSREVQRTPVAAVVEQKPAAVSSVIEKPAALEPDKPAPQAVETFRLAPGIDAPVREQIAKPVPAAKTTSAIGPRLALDVPPAHILPTPTQTTVRVEKRDHVRTAPDRAEVDFRRGAALLTQGRAVEAEEAFGAALAADPAHEAARQALVAMDLEQNRLEEARRLLQEGVALSPGNALFATVLARIYAERRDYGAALEVLNGVKAPGQENPELQSLRGTVLQKLGRDAEAAEAFRMSLRSLPQNGAGWMGLGISLESLGKKAEASDAFRRAAGAGTLGAEARSYAEQRAHQLQ
ncbi:MAG TPA: tetratricopeptide repeat protein [Steroidobacteraceae bacterium]|jgi:MSHA biogenesis protein MshN